MIFVLLALALADATITRVEFNLTMGGLGFFHLLSTDCIVAQTPAGLLGVVGDCNDTYWNTSSYLPDCETFVAVSNGPMGEIINVGVGTYLLEECLSQENKTIWRAETCDPECFPVAGVANDCQTVGMNYSLLINCTNSGWNGELFNGTVCEESIGAISGDFGEADDTHPGYSINVTSCSLPASATTTSTTSASTSAVSSSTPTVSSGTTSSESGNSDSTVLTIILLSSAGVLVLGIFLALSLRRRPAYSPVQSELDQIDTLHNVVNRKLQIY